MFLGHFAAGMAAKRAAPEASLGLLVLAALFLDVLWPILVLVGFERAEIDPNQNPFRVFVFVHYPLSHSLLTAAMWGVLFAAVVGWATGRLRAAAWCAALVASHWLLDAVVHVPDLPVLPRGPKVGLGLWNDPTSTLAVEGALFAVGLAIYAGATRGRDPAGTLGLWVWAAVLVVLYVATATASPPSDLRTVAWTMLGGIAALAAAAHALDRRREPRARAGPPRRPAAG